MVAENSAIKVRCYSPEGNADPDAARKGIRELHPGLLVQAVRSEAASNEFFVEMVAAQTLHAAETGNLLAKKPEIDLLLRLAGMTQISAAIREAGAKKGEPFLIIVAGDQKAMAKLGVPIGWRRLPSGTLTEGELMRIENAALLNVSRA